MAKKAAAPKHESRKNIKSRLKLNPSEGLISESSPFVYKEAYKTLRTNTVFALAATGEKKVIVVSSAMPGDGKSTTSANLAISLAQSGNKVVLLDADLRKPNQQVIHSLENKRGLSNILSRQCTFDEVVYRGIHENLDIVTSGTIPPNPSELLASAATADLVADLEKKYDYVIIDTPPVLIVADALNFSNIAAGMIVVVRAGTTTYNDVNRVINSLDLADFPLLGFITIGMRASFELYKNGYSSGKYGYKKYGYGYGYGYGHHHTSASQTEGNEADDKPADSNGK